MSKAKICKIGFRPRMTQKPHVIKAPYPIHRIHGPTRCGNREPSTSRRATFQPIRSNSPATKSAMRPFAVRPRKSGIAQLLENRTRPGGVKLHRLRIPKCVFCKTSAHEP